MARLLRWTAQYVGSGILLALFASAPVLATGETWVGFTPAPQLIPHGGLRLEIGTRAYLITPNREGVTSFTITKPVSVTVRRMSDCAVLDGGTFLIEPGTLNEIELTSTGSVTVRQLDDIDSGPGISPGAAPCGTLPPTDVPQGVSGEDRSGILPIILGLAVLGSGLVSPYLRRRIGRHT
jgi:hypothetical protein